MYKIILCFIIYFTGVFSVVADDTLSYEKGKVPSGYEATYEAFISKNLRNLEHTGIYGKPVAFDIEYATIGSFPIIFSNDFITPLYEIENNYRGYRKNKFGKDEEKYEGWFNQKQEKIKNIYQDLAENSSKKEYLVLLGVATNEHSTKNSKDKWIIVINPDNPVNDWRGWVIDSYNQKNMALILTSVDGTALEFLSLPFSDYEILAEKYDDPMYKFIFEPLYDNSDKTMPFDYPFQ